LITPQSVFSSPMIMARPPSVCAFDAISRLSSLKLWHHLQRIQGDRSPTRKRILLA
jgi:hypothetical protein